MTDKTELWDRLGKTDPAATKGFQRAGGFKGTAIKPMWSYRRMTEEYGPCGIGWGINEPRFQIVETNDETLVFCTVSIWHGARENIVFGVGGDKAMAKFSSGIKTDDEAFKKAFTDAITNALKLVGVGADVHMGMFDDSKYVNELKEEFADKRQNPHVTRASDITDHDQKYDERGQPIDNIPLASNPAPKMRVKDARPEYAALESEMNECASLVKLERWAKMSADTIAALPAEWQKILRGKYADKLKSLREEIAA